MEAGISFQKNSKLCLIKLVKLRESPSPEELAKQLMLINDKFDYIVSSYKNLNIKLER
jgi:hypothetical protein